MSADDACRLGGLKYAFLLLGWDEKKTLFLKLNLVVKKIFQWKIQFLYKLLHTWLVSDQWSHSHPLFFLYQPTLLYIFMKNTLLKNSWTIIDFKRILYYRRRGCNSPPGARNVENVSHFSNSASGLFSTHKQQCRKIDLQHAADTEVNLLRVIKGEIIGAQLLSRQ